ncbi:hypothetical protein RI367_002616 [Sorochytrium milnesiophthora]
MADGDVAAFASLLEHAAQAMHTPNTATRVQAEQTLQQLREQLLQRASTVLATSSPDAIATAIAPCAHVIATSTNPVARFHAACFLAAVVASWRLPASAGQDVTNSIRSMQHELAFVMARKEESRPVRQQLLAAGARLLAKCSLSALQHPQQFGTLNEAMWNDVWSAWHATSASAGDAAILDKQQVLLYLKAIVDQFAKLDRFHAVEERAPKDNAQHIPQPWSVYAKCQAHFETTDLLKILQLCLQELFAVHQTLQLNTLDRDAKHAYEANYVSLVVNVVDSAMSWDFSTSGGERKGGDDTQASQVVSIFPVQWRQLLLRTEVPDVLFKLLILTSHNQLIAHRLQQCLLHLCTLPASPGFFSAAATGGGGVAEKTQYAQVLASGLYTICTHKTAALQSPGLAGPQLSGVCDLAHCLVRHYKVLPVLVSCGDVFLRLLEQLTHITAQALGKSHSSSDIDVDDTWRDDATTELFAMWSQIVYQVGLAEVDAAYHPSLVLHPSFDLAGFQTTLRRITNDIFTAYLSSKVPVLSDLTQPPSTWHLSLKGQHQAVGDDDDDDDSQVMGVDGFKDWDTYNDTLIHVATIARLDAQHALQLLSHTMAALTSHVKGSFAACAASSDIKSLEAATPSMLWESLHWLLMITAYVVADAADGETPLIPRPLMEYAAQQAALSADDNLLIKLPHLVLDLVDTLTHPSQPMSQQTLAACVSPQVAETLWWTVQRWSGTYLFLQPDNYPVVPSTGVSVLGAAVLQAYATGSKQLLDFVVQCMAANYYMWTAEEEVLQELTGLLRSFARNSALNNALLHLDVFSQLAQHLMHQLVKMPESLHCPVIEALTMAVIGANRDPQLRNRYFELITGTIAQYIEQTLHNGEFTRRFQEPQVIASVLTSLEMLSGLAMCIDSFNSLPLYDFVARYLTALVDIMKLYRNTSEVAIYVLRLLSAITKRQDMGDLSEQQVSQLTAVVTEVIKQYCSAHAGKQTQSSAALEDERHGDILSVLEMLCYIVSPDYEQLDRRAHWIQMDQPGAVPVYLSNCVFTGVESILPLVTVEVMKMPSISVQCLRLLARLASFHPQRLAQLPAPVLANYQALVAYGLQHSQIEMVNASAFNAVSCLADFALERQARHVPGVTQALEQALDHFLQVVLDLLFNGRAATAQLSNISEASALLIVARPNALMQLAQLRISHEQQADRQQAVAQAFSLLTKSLEQPMVQRRMLSREDVKQFSAALWEFLPVVRASPSSDPDLF